MNRTDLRYKSLLMGILSLILFLNLIPGQAFAICNIDKILPCTTNCNLCHVFELMANILTFILTCLTPIVAGLLLIVGGFYFFIAGANPQDISTAKRIVTAVIVGVVIIFISWVAMNTFLESIGVASWTGLKEGWWKIDCSI